MGKRRFSGLEVILIVILLLLFVVSVVLIVMMALNGGEGPEFVPECPVIPLAERVDCYPDAGASQELCIKRGCCWQPLDENRVPWCFFSTNIGYEVISSSNGDLHAQLKRVPSPHFFGAPIEELVFHAEKQTVNRLRFKITDSQNRRFEVPHEHVKPPSSPPNGAFNYEFFLVKKPFGLRYLQLSAMLPSHNIYGLGEHVHQHFRHDTYWRTWPIFARDAFPNGGTDNLYGHYTFFLCLEDLTGRSFGVFLMNSNAMEVTIQPAPAVTYRTIGGVLDFYILLGDTPEEVVHEYLELIGRPMIPPYWSLGFQLSRWDYGSLEEVKRTVERNRAIELPYDPAIATSRRVNGPYASYDRGTAENAWVMDSDGKTPLLGEEAALTADSIALVCMKELKLATRYPRSAPSPTAANLVPDIKDGVMYSKTLCMDAKQTWGDHYDVHSLYGYSMVLATEVALKRVFGSNRTLMLTRSSFPGVGKYAGHWLGDNAANWNDIKWAIPGMLEFGLFGIPYIGADICGFFDNVTEELCQRWMQVGAFYPFSRNHNAQGYKPQDPASFGADSLLVKTSKHYLNIRYTLLPYLYTLFYKAHVRGDTVVRPMMHEFYSDSATWAVDRQFLWGSHLLITPVLDPGVETITAYIPDAVWYDYETEERLTSRRQQIEMYLPADKLGLHIRGGAILPTQEPAVTTVYR
ncbi:hypothetical protein AAFF_G00187220 [Aldrovandia affinis]|uniref:Maltase n=1 Tax=Aldrovandia affinis TaxID=143900 RepID=A0AAD7SXW5_9TELE|nr:hypothetical protein AAFF_G00187220 [Aldrovandia affinis]